MEKIGVFDLTRQYAANLEEKEYCDIREQMERDEVCIIDFIGLKGEIDKREFEKYSV